MLKERTPSKKDLKMILGTCKAFTNICNVFDDVMVDDITDYECRLMLERIYSYIIDFKNDFV